MLARFAIEAEEIEQVTRAFYAKVRAHPVLGPVFAAHVEDWHSHEAKIAGFWRNAILLERSYSGNPMQVHKAAGNVRAEHFPEWLALFDETLAEHLLPDVASAWSALAHRIGRGLALGLIPVAKAGGPPPRFI
ncbi:group III truncated hemoglobin [Planktotalea arctica]|uniref:group III truncated hemoglobin n=1 Tax=Planktotalea arctica TaxID=1481893 RepID=UPI000A178155|nr:group III truncated hemoglobin [Planktotalea arctica]